MDIYQGDYRPNVAAIILNHENLIFVGERADAPGSWQIPQGGISSKKDKNPEQALWRELEEELGLENPKKYLNILGQHPKWLKYEFPDYIRQKGGRFARYKGQIQKYFLLRFSGNDKMFTLEKNGEREFINFKWQKPDKITESVADFKVKVTLSALQWFKEQLNIW